LGVLPDGDADRARLEQLLRVHAIDGIVLYDPDSLRMTGGLREVTAGQPPRWELVRVYGGAVLAVPRGSPHAGTRFDPERAVFGPPSPDDVPPAGPGPATLAEPAPLWEVRPGRGRQGSWEADSATVYLRLFEDAPVKTADRSPALPLLAVRAGRR